MTIATIKKYKIALMAVILGIVLLIVSANAFITGQILSQTGELKWIMFVGGLLSFVAAVIFYRQEKRGIVDKPVSKETLAVAAVFGGPMNFFGLLSKNERIRREKIYKKKQNVGKWIALQYVWIIGILVFTLASILAIVLLLLSTFEDMFRMVIPKVNFFYALDFIVLYLALLAVCIIGFNKVLKKIYEPRLETEKK